MELTSQQEVMLSIAAYSFCSGTLVLFNKLTLSYLPFPSLVVCFQILGCIILIYGLQMAGKINVDPIKWEYAKPYMLYILFFSTGIYCNMRSLNIANVETVIVFRALTPIIVTFLDAIFLGREWPSTRSWIGLCTLVVGAYGYASYDEKFQSQGMSAYFWPSWYTIIIALEMAYGKKIVKSVPLETRSGPVIYTNLLGFIPMLMLASIGSEYTKFWDFWWSTDHNHIPAAGLALLIIGSLVGTAIGYSGWWCRSVVSATSFTLVGVMNKCLTILLNVLIWDQHAKPGGIFSLFICIAGGIIYQQAPMKGEKQQQQNSQLATADASDDAFQSDVPNEAHSDGDEETMNLLERQGSNVGGKESTAAKRRA